MTEQHPVEAPPGRGGRRSLLAALGIAAILVGGGGAATVLTARHSATPPRSGLRPTPTSRASASAAAPAAAAPSSLAEFVPQARAFVERERGLRFKAQVPVTALDDAAFRQKLLGDRTTQSSQSIAQTGKELRALHLIAPGVDLNAAADSLLGAGVVGFYDSKAKQLYVRGVKPTPYVREVLVHELTHALQDQWFGLDRPALANSADEQGDAFTALVEGDAVRVEKAYLTSLSAADRAAAEREQTGAAGGLPPNIPDVLIELVAFPYEAGPDFVSAVLGARGQAGLDAAFRQPPTTTAQILDPQRFLDGAGPRPVATPSPEGTAFDHGALGELGYLLLLEHAAQRGTLPRADAVAAAQAWAGDRYVAWEQGSNSCLRDTVAGASADGQTALDGALRRVAAAQSGVSGNLTGSGPVTVTFCG